MPISVHCPFCNARFAVSEALAGRKARCKKCQTVFQIPTLVHDGDTGLIALAGSEPAPPEVDVPQAVARPLGATALRVAPDELASEQARHGTGADMISAPTRRFWQDALMSFAAPFGGNGLFVLIVLVVLASLRSLLAYAGFFGLLGRLAITGWLWAYYLNVIVDSARGEPDLPHFAVDGGFWESVFRPMFTFLGSIAWVALPFVAWAVVRGATGGVLGDPLDDWLSLGLGLLGLFLWPMVVLSVALDGWNPSILRYDLQLASIVRALGPYLLVWGLLVLAVGGMTAGAALVGQLGRMGYSTWQSALGLGIVAALGISLVEVWAGLAAMRIIGLFYCHFKRRFAWIAE